MDNASFLLTIDRMSETRLHIKNALFHPMKTASLLPSSERLCDLIVKEAKVSSARVIVEFGPGTGAITEKIVKKTDPETTLVAMEINPDFAERTKKKFPRAFVFNRCAGDSRQCLESLEIAGCDRVVSGLPWAAFSDSLQKKILAAAESVLNPGGIFVSFAYAPIHMLPSGRRFRRNLETVFAKVEKTEILWGNLPPAFVYRACK